MSDKNNKNDSFEDSFQNALKRYHYTLSPREIDEMQRTIHKRINRKNRRQKQIYWRIAGSVAVAASIALLVFFRFQGLENTNPVSTKPGIATFADMFRHDTRTGDIQLVLSDEKSILFDRKETVITYDTTGILVDRELISQNESTGFNQLIVPLAKRSVLNLSDGTKIWINSDSRLIYPVSFANDIREIYVDGEIYIEVAEEAYRPFVVHTKGMDVRVLGTKFNVTAYESDDKKKIVLVSGLVEIVSKKGEIATRLFPDELYAVENGQVHVEKVDTRKYISWIDGIYYCENESLENILQKLSRFYGVEIICAPSVAGVIFSGKLDLKDKLSDILDGISFTLPVIYSENNEKYVIFPNIIESTIKH